MIFFGIDPGTSTSPTAVAVIDENKILEIISILPPKSVIKSGLRDRILYICNEVSKMFDVSCVYPECIGIEESVYRGKANNSLLRFLGALENIIPEIIPVIPVNPMTLKKFITGSGKAEKIDIVKSLMSKWFTDKKSQNILDKILKYEKWDSSDAIAVATFARERFMRDIKQI